MESLPRKLMSATAILFGIGAIGFAALPVPVDQQEQGKLTRTLQLSPETTQARSNARMLELPASLDLTALPQGATTREVEVVAPPVVPTVPEQESELPMAQNLAVKVVQGPTTREAEVAAPPVRPSVSEKEFELPMAENLAVKVVDTTGRSLSGARLSWTRVDGTETGKGRCDSAGYFESETLPAGQYQLRVESADFSRKTTLLVQIPRRLGESQQVVFDALP
jgi:hypothetical protein